MSNQKSYYNPNRKKSHEQITDITATGMHFRSSAKECFFVKRHTRKAPALSGLHPSVQAEHRPEQKRWQGYPDIMRYRTQQVAAHFFLFYFQVNDLLCFDPARHGAYREGYCQNKQHRDMCICRTESTQNHTNYRGNRKNTRGNQTILQFFR